MTDIYFENNAARAVGVERYVIFSVRPADRLQALSALRRWGINHKTVQGLYRDTLETSYVVNHKDWCAVRRFVWWAVSEQESVLHLGPVDRVQDARPAVLEYLHGGAPEFIGWFYAVSRGAALKAAGWTCDAGLRAAPGFAPGAGKVPECGCSVGVARRGAGS